MAEQKFFIDKSAKKVLTQAEQIKRANEKERSRNRRVRRKMKQFAQ